MANRKFTISVDVEDLKSIYSGYGEETLDAAIDKIIADLRRKIFKAVDLPTCQISPKVLIEG